MVKNVKERFVDKIPDICYNKKEKIVDFFTRVKLMRRFDAGDGLCHLVFANEDTYFLGSLLKLNLRQYLYYELKGKGYEGIYFLSGEEGRLFLTFGDAASQAVYERYTEQSAGRKLKNWFWGKEEHADCSGRPLPVSDEIALFNRILRMMKGEKGLAFVFRIETFFCLSDYQELIEDFCRAAQTNYSRGHILLIQSPVMAGGSRRFLTDPRGVFQSPLFPEIQMIFSGNKNVRIYEKLAEVMGQRISFLNTLEREDISRMVRHLLVEQGTAMAGFWTGAEDCADVIWGWYHSSQYRAEAGPILPENEKRLMSAVQTWISDKNNFLKLNREADRLRKLAGGEVSLSQWITGNFLADSWQRLIYEDNVLLNRLDGLAVPLSWRQEGGSWLRTLGQIREELKKPSTMSQNPGEEAYVFECVEHMSLACSRKDRLTMEKSLEALRYGVCDRFSASWPREGENARQELYRSIIQVSEKLYDVTRLYEEDGQKISEYRTRMQACIRAAHDFERDNGLTGQDLRYGTGKMSGDNSARLHSLSAKKTEAVNLRYNIRSCEHLRAQKEMLMARCRENIQKMEMALSNLAVGSMDNLKENMAYVAKLVQNAAADSNVALAELAEASREVRFTMEEASGMYEEENAMNLADIEREFEELLSEEHSGQGEEIEKAVWING